MLNYTHIYRELNPDFVYAGFSQDTALSFEEMEKSYICFDNLK